MSGLGFEASGVWPLLQVSGMEATLQRLITKQLRALTADQAWTMTVLGV